VIKKNTYKKPKVYKKPTADKKSADYKKPAEYKRSSDSNNTSDHTKPAGYKKSTGYKKPVDYKKPGNFKKSADYKKPADYKKYADSNIPAEYGKPAGYKKSTGYKKSADYKKPAEYKKPSDFEKPTADFKHTADKKSNEYKKRATFKKSTAFKKPAFYKKLRADKKAAADSKPTTDLIPTTDKISADDKFVRLNKFIAANGISSRRKIDEMILQERVTVNGKTVNELGFKIDPGFDKVKVDGELVRTDTKKVYIMLNKPKGIITSVKDEKRRTTVIDLIKLNQKIFPVGRLDYNTSGLLLLTNDGEFANHLMSPKSKVHKTYYVELSKPLEEKHRIKLSEGIKIDGIRTAPAKIKYVKSSDYHRLYISIYEGKNRQIHNMFEHYGYFVRELMRVEYSGLKLEGLNEGNWRYLTAEEVSKLK